MNFSIETVIIAQFLLQKPIFYVQLCLILTQKGMFLNTNISFFFLLLEDQFSYNISDSLPEIYFKK